MTKLSVFFCFLDFNCKYMTIPQTCQVVFHPLDGYQVVQWFTLFPHSKKALNLNLPAGWEPSSVGFTCSPCDCVGLL